MTHTFRNSRKIWRFTLPALLMLLSASFASESFAAEPYKELGQRIVESDVDFNSLGVDRDIVLDGPFAEWNLFFSLPENWQPTENANLSLSFDVLSIYVGENAELAAANDRFLSGTLEVSLNGELLETIQLRNNGARTEQIPISREAIDAVNEERRFRLSVVLRSGSDCTQDLNTKVTLRSSSSQFTFPHTFIQPPTDLTLLPRPIYQRSFLPDEALVVVPDDPTAAEMEAAMTVVSGFGNMSNGNLLISLATVNEIPEELLPTNHLIFVGTRDRFPILDQVALPVPMNEDGFNAAGAQTGDGLVQMGLSPWNNNGVVLVVTGVDDESVIKAGQAVSTGNIQVSRRRSLAVVAEVQPQAFVRTFTNSDQTFATLGYGTRSIEGVGRDSLDYRFFVPPGFRPESEVFLDLSFVHTAVIDFNQSTLQVIINDDPIGSILLSDETTKLSTVRLPIPGEVIKPGINQIEVEGNLIATSVCEGEDSSDLWLTVRPESNLHLPLERVNPLSQSTIFLEAYPDPFVFDPVLGRTALVIPKNDVESWKVAAQLAFDLGDRADVSLSNLAVAFGDDVPLDLRRARDLLIVGKPTNLPIIDEINNDLPAPFQPGTDRIEQERLPINYRLPNNASLGYLELLQAPWDNQRTIFAVLGRTDEGVQQAANALLDSGLRSRLDGDFASIVGEQIATLNTQFNAGAVVPQAQPAVSDTLLDESVTAPTDGVEENAWISNALTVSITLMALVILFVGGTALWQRFGSNRPSV